MNNENTEYGDRRNQNLSKEEQLYQDNQKKAQEMYDLELGDKKASYSIKKANFLIQAASATIPSNPTTHGGEEKAIDIPAYPPDQQRLLLDKAFAYLKNIK